MKIKLTEKEAQQVEIAAVQKLVQDQIQNIIDDRSADMRRELDASCEEYTLVEIQKKFLGSRPIIDTESTQKSLLIPAGVKLDPKI